MTSVGFVCDATSRHYGLTALEQVRVGINATTPRVLPMQYAIVNHSLLDLGKAEYFGGHDSKHARFIFHFTGHLANPVDHATELALILLEVLLLQELYLVFFIERLILLAQLENRSQIIHRPRIANKRFRFLRIKQ